MTDAPLDRVAVAAQRAASAHDELVAEVRVAVAAGAKITHVADAAQVTRQTIYRWIGDE